MTADELTTLRKTLGLTQTEMATRIGLGLRAYQSIENGSSPVRESHALAAEHVALSIAVERADPMLAPARIRKLALGLANLITEGHA